MRDQEWGGTNEYENEREQAEPSWRIITFGLYNYDCMIHLRVVVVERRKKSGIFACMQTTAIAAEKKS